MKIHLNLRRNWLILFALLLPFSISFKDIITGIIPFWFDPARDALAALSNLKKPSLLGPPTGIPGIFYGPYWIWMLSFPLIISKDPRFLAFSLQLLPYFTIFPFVLFKLTKTWGREIFIILWLLFIYAFKNYSTYLWNPHMAPLLFLILIYLVNIYEFKVSESKDILLASAIGFTAGLIANFHMSFGITLVFSLYIYSCLRLFKKGEIKAKSTKIIKSLKSLLTITLGLFIAYIPFLVFEVRHGFNQSAAILKNLSDALHGQTEIGLQGMSANAIIQRFLITPSLLLKIPNNLAWLVYIFALLFVIHQNTKKAIKFDEWEQKLIKFITLSSICLLAVFLSASNPIWEYHFIGVEIIFLLLLGLLLRISKVAKKFALIWVAVLSIIAISNFVKSFKDNPLEIQSLAAKINITEKIYQDANQQTFALHAYSPSIYTYDFDYLFEWIAKKKNINQPTKQIEAAEVIYLIIPETSKAIEADFINYKTPNDKFKTLNQWLAPDKTLVVKRKII